MIPLVRSMLQGALEKDHKCRIYDLFDENEPEQFLVPQRRYRRGHYRDGCNQSEWDRRLRQNLELVRGASAIGGCSVFFESPYPG